VQHNAIPRIRPVNNLQSHANVTRAVTVDHASGQPRTAPVVLHLAATAVLLIMLVMTVSWVFTV
jgi:hypothetical protein